MYGCQSGNGLKLAQGLLIQSSQAIRPGTYQFPGGDSLDTPVITIQGNNLVLDFAGVTLAGSTQVTAPDQFKGLGILIKDSRHVVIKNLTASGYKVALMAVNTDSLQLIDCDFSYNYRPRLHSKIERENLIDWLSYHQNDQDEWLRYGAGIYLKNCTDPIVKGVKITQNQNALLMTGCKNGLIYNNSFHFNSGLGIGLYRSTGNRILHNRLDWNVRGYSHEIYQRGQDSAGILCYEQCSDNIFAFNSATHSGDGFFLWPGQSTIDSGQGGCNNNLIYANNFSFAPANGVEITFSSNQVVGNIMDECRYGVWGGYSWNTLIQGNTIQNCDYGVAIENGQDNTISRNNFKLVKTGIQLFERAFQPEEWAYARVKDVSTRNHQIKSNLFFGVNNTFHLSGTRNTAITDSNQIHESRVLLAGDSPNENLLLTNNDFYMIHSAGQAGPYIEGNRINNPPDNARWKALEGRFITPVLQNTELPLPLPDGINAGLPPGHLTGRQYILINEWGPYNFEYPSVWLRKIDGDEYIFLLAGPEGNWKAASGAGFVEINPKTGTFPATVRAKKRPGATGLNLNFEFVGQAFTDQFGQKNKKGKVYPFSFNRAEPAMVWSVRFYTYDDSSHPITHYEVFKNLQTQPPLTEKILGFLAFNWWSGPDSSVPADRFATFASTAFQIDKGQYRITVASDDGIKLFLDGQLILDRWDVHEPVVDMLEVDLGGEHRFEIEHFDEQGAATLDFYIERVGKLVN